MTPKEYMEEADRLRRRIRRKESEIRSLRERAEGMNGMGNSDMPKTVSPNPHKLEAAIGRITELEQEVEEIKAELNRLTSSFKNRILSIDNSDISDLLIKRYIEFKPWKTIAAEMFMSERQAYYLHKEGILLLE